MIQTRYSCAALGIVPTVRHAHYIGSLLEVLREDSRAVVRTASAASKAADYLLAFLPRAGGRSMPEQDRLSARA
jgi:antirestriction protein ArdC